MKHYGGLCVKKTLVSLSVSTLSLLLVVAIIQVVKSSTANYIDVLADRLSTGTRDVTLREWHTTCFRGCGLAIERAVARACENDPYRVNTIHRWRRSINDTTTHHKVNKDYISIPKPLRKKEHDHPVFLSKLRAASFLKTRNTRSVSPSRRGGANIVFECCISKACVWEEYGEYCQMHSRQRPPARASACGS